MSPALIAVLFTIAFLIITNVMKAQQAKAARALIEGGALVIDVRTPGEFAAGHLARAENIPLNDLPRRMKEIEKRLKKKDQPIVVYCRSGNRSGMARRFLVGQGFSQVVNGGAFAMLQRATRV